MIKIIVDSEETKQDLLKQSEYIHDFVIEAENSNMPRPDYIMGLDPEKASTLMHIYMNPDLIIVQDPIIEQSIKRGIRDSDDQKDKDAANDILNDAHWLEPDVPNDAAWKVITEMAEDIFNMRNHQLLLGIREPQKTVMMEGMLEAAKEYWTSKEEDHSMYTALRRAMAKTIFG